MGRNKLGLKGQRFGRWLVIEKVGVNKHRNVLWKVKCNCGTEGVVQKSSLTTGKSQSCGCLRNEVTSRRCKKDLVGEKFSMLVVLEEAGVNKHGSILWLCKCFCGIEKEVAGTNLRNGDTKSCGCLLKKYKDLTDKKFGGWIVLKEAGRDKHKNILWLCRCVCGIEKVIKGSYLTGGRTGGCGKGSCNHSYTNGTTIDIRHNREIRSKYNRTRMLRDDPSYTFSLLKAGSKARNITLEWTKGYQLVESVVRATLLQVVLV